MELGFTTAAYVVAAILFILSLGGLSGQESAKRAVWYGIVGMALAVSATLMGPGAGLWLISVIMIAAGGAIGWVVAKKVQMTEMPQLVAAMHSLVGLAAVFVGYNTHITLSAVMPVIAEHAATGTMPAAYESLTGFARIVAHKTLTEVAILKVETFLGVFIGAVTFTGSVVAFGKLAGKLTSKAVKLPGGHMLNAAAAAGSLLLLLAYANGAGAWALVLMTLLAFFIGYHLIMGIGGVLVARGTMEFWLFRLGGSRDRLHARQRPLDRHRCAGRLFGRDPLLHHVQGDEPLVHLGHSGRLWQYRRPGDGSGG